MLPSVGMIPGTSWGKGHSVMGEIRDWLRNERIFGRVLTEDRSIVELIAVTLGLGVVLRLAYLVAVT
jgi:hypothetical protein